MDLILNVAIRLSEWSDGTHSFILRDVAGQAVWEITLDSGAGIGTARYLRVPQDDQETPQQARPVPAQPVLSDQQVAEILAVLPLYRWEASSAEQRRRILKNECPSLFSTENPAM